MQITVIIETKLRNYFIIIKISVNWKIASKTRHLAEETCQPPFGAMFQLRPIKIMFYMVNFIVK